MIRSRSFARAALAAAASPSLSEPSAPLQKFFSDYKTKYGSNPDAIAGLAYDAANLVVDALKRMQASDPASVARTVPAR